MNKITEANTAILNELDTNSIYLIFRITSSIRTESVYIEQDNDYQLIVNPVTEFTAVGYVADKLTAMHICDQDHTLNWREVNNTVLDYVMTNEWRDQ